MTEPCTCDPAPIAVLPDSSPVHVTDERGLWHAEQVGERVHVMHLLEPSEEEQARIDARADAVAEQERDRRIGATLDRRERLLAALALRASSGWSSLPAGARQRVQAVIDQAAERVRDQLS